MAVGVITALAGYGLCVNDHASYGLAMFCLLPLLTGFSVGAIVRRKEILAASLITVGIFSGIFLVATGLEGIICVFMAAPFMGFGMAIGGLFGYLLIGRKREQRRRDAMKTFLLLFAMPLIMAAAERIERPMRTDQRRETFATTIDIDASPEKTWESLTQIPELMGEKPFLLAVGLPVPTSCSLGEVGLGSERVCYFNQGKIVQRVSVWEPNESLGVSILESTLPGRRWLQFIDAEYKLTRTKKGTRLTRFSTIGSRLYPRWYWRGFEEWGVVSEHEYVLANIKRIAEGE
ncbi:MAG: hypothetical protein KDA68_14975 [Planctomycetaceae bacterium]|nr:hypothetical protein [Planctomycetaceae bacterium]